MASPGQAFVVPGTQVTITWLMFRNGLVPHGHPIGGGSIPSKFKQQKPTLDPVFRDSQR